MDHHHKTKVGLGRRGEDYRTSNVMNQENIREEDIMDLRRGPWTVEEDFTLINFIAHHGEGRWNSLARCAGLKRTGKSCRLRWLNYLRPDVRRGNITLEEQLLILELHSRWGNRWSKIAQHLPGRTDNEIKNYWRTRVQKHAKQLKCDVNSKQFKDTMKYLWMPRLVERIQAAATTAATSTTTTNTYIQNLENQQSVPNMSHMSQFLPIQLENHKKTNSINHSSMTLTLENSSTTTSSDNSIGRQVSPISDLTDCYYNFSINQSSNNQDYTPFNQNYGESLISATRYFPQAVDQQNSQWMDSEYVSDNSWNIEDMWFLQQQLNNNL